jgi:molybdopterin synthase catalytic subunit
MRDMMPGSLALGPWTFVTFILIFSSMFRISSAPIDPASLQRELRDLRAGACASFEGWVRNRNDGQTVQALDYEAYVPLAEKEGDRILAEAREKFAILSARCVHRIGSLALGDLAIWVGVAAEHRGPAFEACRYIVDEAKARVPIWKKERYAGGATAWINCATRGPGAQGNPPTD